MIADGFRIVVQYNSDQQQYIANVPELGTGIRAEGQTRIEAMEKAEEAIESEIRHAAEEERKLPTPIDMADFDGQLSIELSADVHRELVFLAYQNNTKAEKLAAELIVAGITRKTSPRAAPSAKHNDRNETKDNGRKRGRGRQRKDYHSIMDDRASFIEYVRGMERRGGGSHKRR
jgi:predicted RNase H-like HicB family nuclease